MQKIFILSDTHFNHKNVIKYSSRPFNNVDEMNKQLITNWNYVVGEDDIVLFLGDFAFVRYSKQGGKEDLLKLTTQLKGHKIIIKGNHDNKKVRYIECGFDYEAYQELKVNKFIFLHNPSLINKQYTQQSADTDFHDILKIKHEKTDCYIFYGHVHNNDYCPITPYSRNVCVECIEYIPLDITKMFSKSAKKDIVNLLDK